MVFTVLSGSSESFGNDSFVKVGRKAFIDIIATNRLFIRDTKASVSQLRSRSFVKENAGLRDYLNTNTEDSSLNYIQSYILPLIILVYFSNNLIFKNNIWKNAVF